MDPSVLVLPVEGAPSSDTVVVRVRAAHDDPLTQYYEWATSGTTALVVLAVGFGNTVGLTYLYSGVPSSETLLGNCVVESAGVVPFEMYGFALPIPGGFDVDTCTNVSLVRMLAPREQTEPLVGLGPLPASLSFTLEGHPWSLGLEGITDPPVPPEGESETRVAEVSVPILFEVYEE